MGQRLIITIQNKEQTLAKAYYHWSRYTTPGLLLGCTAVDHYAEAIAQTTAKYVNLYAFDKEMVVENKINTLVACLMLFGTGAGLMNNPKTDTAPEIDAFVTHYPVINYMIATNHSDGLIAITEKGMEQMQKYSEADMTIDIHSKCVDVSGLFFDMAEEENDVDKKPYEKAAIPEEYDLERITFDQLIPFTDTIISAIMDNDCYEFSYRDKRLGAKDSRVIANPKN